MFLLLHSNVPHGLSEGKDVKGFQKDSIGPATQEVRHVSRKSWQRYDSVR